ncbi:MAG: hypothetical protein AAB531_00320 [Patescibacteria group bacterium]|mgnify:CR=1 FL=1
MIQIPFQQWFTFHHLIGGDWRFFWPENLKEILSYSFAWDSSLNTGIGRDNLSTLWLNSYVAYLSNFLTQILHTPWNIAEKLIFFWPIVFISFFSAFFISRMFFRNIFLNILSGFIYLTNSYALMIFSGGQVGVALAYSLAPLALARFIKITDLKLSIIAGLVLALQILFDPRIAYVTFSALGIYFLSNLKQLVIDKDLKEIVVNISYIFIIPFAVFGLLHAFWILPLLIFHQDPVRSFGAVYTSAEAVKFFSFAKFENTISLLHPNWPENIFGKVGFMKPEFLVLPILAYSSLFFISKIKNLQEKEYIIFFTLLGLAGAFLAKGANEPFGGVYLWMFDNIPGFIMFRDPTKWYTLVAISYSVLIPFTVWKTYEWLRSRSKFLIFNFPFGLAQGGQFSIKSKIFNVSNLFLLAVVFYLLFLIRPALLGQLTGTFKSKEIPKEYISLEKYISKDSFFYRTFWVPKTQRFGFYSSLHPAIPAQDFIKEANYSQILKNLRMTEMEMILQESSVKYVIIPYDSEGEIFLKDRKYDRTLYDRTVGNVKKIKWLKEIGGFGKIAVFEMPNSRDHFWSSSATLGINYKYINPTKYEIIVKNAKKSDVIVFSESFDKNWIARNESIKYKVSSIKYHELFNSFVLPQNGDYSLTVYYTPQDWVNVGLWVSGLSLLTISSISSILFGFKLRKW